MMPLFLSPFVFFQTTPVQVPSNPTWEWIVGVLAVVILGMAGLFSTILRHYIKNYIPKSSYEDAMQTIRELEQRCRDCDLTNGECLLKIYALLAELSKTTEMEVQSSAAMKHLLEMMLWGGGPQHGTDGH